MNFHQNNVLASLSCFQDVTEVLDHSCLSTSSLSHDDDRDASPHPHVCCQELLDIVRSKLVARVWILHGGLHVVHVGDILPLNTENSAESSQLDVIREGIKVVGNENGDFVIPILLSQEMVKILMHDISFDDLIIWIQET